MPGLQAPKPPESDRAALLADQVDEARVREYRIGTVLPHGR
jgi:hypothetical protein